MSGTGPAKDGETGGDAGADWLLSLLRRHEGPLLRYACRLTGDADRARDVVQETFVRLCSQSPAELDGHAAAWLYTVCRRRALDVRRKERRMSMLSVVQAEARPAAELGPQAVAEGRERGGRLMELLAALPERQQEAVVLKYQGGLSYAEIAGVMGTNVNNVGVLMHKAMTTLRKRMMEMEGPA